MTENNAFSHHALAIAYVILVAVFATAQTPTVKPVPVPRTSPASGKEMYLAYCASCHGRDGKGGGPVAAALKVPPPDLTTLARHDNGKFPADRVYQAIRGDVNLPAHGNKEMPVWGTFFWAMSNAPRSEVQLRMTNLTQHIESLQEK